MGFQVADLETFAESMAQTEGVSGIWLLSDPEERTCTMIVAVKGFDGEGQDRRLAVRNLIEDYVSKHAEEMRDNRLIFDYRLTVDEPNLGPLHIPAGAHHVAAAL